MFIDNAMEDKGIKNFDESRTAKNQADKDSLKISRNIWGVCWDEFLPQYSDSMSGFHLEYGKHDAVGKYLNANEFLKDTEIQNREDNFSLNSYHPSKSNFIEYFCDEFLIMDSITQSVVGIVICQVTDWSTYYIRFVSIKSDYKGRGLFQNFIFFLNNVLFHRNVERIEIEISPINGVQLHTLNKVGFIITSTSMSERWGYILRLTKFLDINACSKFLNQFCSGPISGLGKSAIDETLAFEINERRQS